MLYLAYAEDVPGSDEKRVAMRDVHVAYMRGTPEVMVLGGALVDDRDVRFGSCLLIAAPDLATARSWFENVPWIKAGLFKSVRIARVKKEIWRPEVAVDSK